MDGVPLWVSGELTSVRLQDLSRERNYLLTIIHDGMLAHATLPLSAGVYLQTLSPNDIVTVYGTAPTPSGVSSIVIRDVDQIDSFQVDP